MKRKLIVIAIVLLALLMFGFRYSVVEKDDVLPEEVRLGLSRLLGAAKAEGTETATEEPSAQPTAEPTHEPAPTPIPTPEPVLETGDSGDEVRALQKRLGELGFASGGADGHFGAKTAQAVKAFREHVHALETERAEAARQAHLKAVSRAMAVQQAILAAQRPVLPRAEHEQRALLEAQIPERPAKAAVRREQPEPVFEGKVDEETYNLIVGRGFDEYQGLLSGGSRGAEVKRLQQRLRALGYLTGNPDGVFGKQTVNAVSDFQKRNKLTQDGVAGERTQRALYSASAVRQAKKPTHPYLLKISTKDQKVYAYGWSEADEAHTRLVRTMVCSTGLADTPTPKGTFKNTSPVVRWGYFPKYDVWAQYLYRIQGPYLFHSVLYDEADESTVKWGSVNKLGSPASHGCIRLKVEDAKWIYENCPAGTTVTVY